MSSKLSETQALPSCERTPALQPRQRVAAANIFAAAAFLACVCLPQYGFAGDESAGFYAGPLSATAKIVVKKAKPAAKALPQPSDDATQKTGKSTSTKTKKTEEHSEEKTLPSPS